LAVLTLLIAAPLTYCYFAMVRMPGVSHVGQLPPLTADQQQLATDLRATVEHLASGVGKRSTFQPKSMAQAGRWIIEQLEAAGYADHEEVFVDRGSRAPNIAVEVGGTRAPTEIIVVGAHYDSYQGTPGADDNASGVAACLALARRFAGVPQPRTIRFVFFVNEEPPSFQTKDMGSWVYAKHCRTRNDNVVAMLSLETLGFYTDIVGYQQYPPLVGKLYPEKGDFIGFVGNYTSRGLVKRAIGAFRASTPFPSEGAALPSGVPGVGWSDHWAFWQEGYPGIMVTDTANYRNPHYHIDSDRPDTLDYACMARVVTGLEAALRDLADPAHD
jgi:Zn-dependent M28 family amino/carboxypeptidase